jgi:hypothetical protein
MTKPKNIKSISTGKIITVLLMCFCLLFLTGINFVLYPPDLIAAVTDLEEGETENNNPSGPVEEKTVSSGSLAEEFLHDHFYLDVSVINKLLLHKIHEAEKLQIVHFEILSPPPDSIS